MVYGDFKDLNRRTTADKVLRDKAFNTAKNPKYEGYQRGFPSIVCNFFHKPIIRKFKKRMVHLPFTGNICGANLAYM